MQGIIALGGKKPQVFPRVLRDLPAIGADSGFDFLLEKGFKVEIVIGDLDSTEKDPQSLGVPYRRFPTDKDESDAQLAFDHAREVLHWSRWQVIGGSGARIDHFLALLGLIPLYSEWEEWWMENDHAFLLSKGKKIACPALPGQRVSIVPLGYHPPRLSATGLRWSIDRLDWTQMCSLSNETMTDNFSVYCEFGHAMVIRSLEVAVEFRI